MKYEIDPVHSHVGFTIKHLGIVPVNGQFKKFSGSFNYDPKTQKMTNIKIMIDVDSIDTNEKDRDIHLRNDDFFGVRDKFYNIVEARRYIVFTANQAQLKDKKVSGKLKILNTTKNVTLEANMSETHTVSRWHV